MSAKKTRMFLPGFLLVAVVIVGFAAGSCRSPIPNRVPVGETFPSTQGETLDGTPFRLPEDVTGQPAVLLMGYVQKAQFDADRWAFGMLQAGTPVRILEVPAIPGLLPKLASGFIDNGMKSGIPEEDWASVVTVYGAAAEPIVEFTGNTNPRNMRVALLDADGVVRWFHDRGFSGGKLLELDRAARELAP